MSRLLTAAVLVLCMAFSGSAMAASVTLDTLLGGDTFTSGDLTFSNFSYSGVSTGGGLVPLASEITVSDIAGGILFQFTAIVLGDQTVDMLLGFDVTAPTAFTGVTLSSTGSGTGDAVASVSEVVSSHANLLNLFSDSITKDTDSATFDGGTTITVRKDIGLASTGRLFQGRRLVSDGSVASMSDVSQVYTNAVPTPTAAGGGLLLGLGLLARRRRQQG